ILQTWSEKVHEDILIAFKENLKLGPDEWARVMAHLGQMGYKFSEGALSLYTKWDGPVYEAVLTAFSSVLKPSSKEYGQIMGLLHGMGHNITQEALRFAVYLVFCPNSSV
ncbi:uncharacterized protein BCR38DRAFT_343121, partial [Pseudomassariella vexata]